MWSTFEIMSPSSLWHERISVMDSVAASFFMLFSSSLPPPPPPSWKVRKLNFNRIKITRKLKREFESGKKLSRRIFARENFVFYRMLAPHHPQARDGRVGFLTTTKDWLVIGLPWRAPSIRSIPNRLLLSLYHHHQWVWIEWIDNRMMSYSSESQKLMSFELSWKP